MKMKFFRCAIQRRCARGGENFFMWPKWILHGGTVDVTGRWYEFFICLIYAFMDLSLFFTTVSCVLIIFMWIFQLVFCLFKLQPFRVISSLLPHLKTIMLGGVSVGYIFLTAMVQSEIQSEIRGLQSRRIGYLDLSQVLFFLQHII